MKQIVLGMSWLALVRLGNYPGYMSGSDIELNDIMFGTKYRRATIATRTNDYDFLLLFGFPLSTLI